LLKGRWMREEAIDEASYRHRVGKLVASRWDRERWSCSHHTSRGEAANEIVEFQKIRLPPK
jgi:hypothetical protein